MCLFQDCRDRNPLLLVSEIRSLDNTSADFSVSSTSKCPRKTQLMSVKTIFFNFPSPVLPFHIQVLHISRSHFSGEHFLPPCCHRCYISGSRPLQDARQGETEASASQAIEARTAKERPATAAHGKAHASQKPGEQHGLAVSVFVCFVFFCSSVRLSRLSLFGSCGKKLLFKSERQGGASLR